MDKFLCTQAYNDSVDAVARLATFCTSDYVKKIGHGQYEDRAVSMASRDMMLMCISLRRLADLTATQAMLRQEQIRAFTPKRQGENLDVADAGHGYSAWDILGNVIHAKLLLIVTDDAELKHLLYATNDIDSILQAITKRKQIEPVCFIKSDKGAKGFRSLHLVKAAVRYLEDIEDVLGDNRIFVGGLMFD